MSLSREEVRSEANRGLIACSGGGSGVEVEAGEADMSSYDRYLPCLHTLFVTCPALLMKSLIATTHSAEGIRTAGVPTTLE